MVTHVLEFAAIVLGVLVALLLLLGWAMGSDDRY